MRPSQLLVAAVAVSSVSAAWADDFGNQFSDVIYGRSEVKNVLYGRQNDDKSTSAAASVTQKNDATSTSGAKESAKATTTNQNDSKSTGKASGSATTRTTKKTQTTFAADLPAGGISMITPAAIAGAQYYKVGDWVTLAWNYTSLSITPSNIDIMATCTANQATYTLAVNQTVGKGAATILWDTKGYQETASVPLLTETYTLMVYDSASSPSAAAKPGYLGLANSFTFGMYIPQEAVAWQDFKCANCNAAGSSFESLTLRALFITSGTTVFSLLYFAFSFGLL
ncbi:hypothetical protein K504DRAFT_464379 [Pleomassaria siparia CBS 279.74]|uniref:DUF7137 domain-containing protein n=1 Tax=Pleomassaria siparia CBS 279.74 TaxID=1314801 RepID=A0A6G1KHI7_9PLEO|nr:hypothetical protein K504DRAFT_464379 [Pleomassaria siparia CBS 279.74]